MRTIRPKIRYKYYNLVIAFSFLFLNLGQHCGTSEVLEFEFESEFILFNLWVWVSIDGSGGLYKNQAKKKNMSDNTLSEIPSDSKLRLICLLSYTRHAPLSLSQVFCHNIQLKSIREPNINGAGIVPNMRTPIHWIPKANDFWLSATHLK
jgi:hypothetical protein